MMSATSTFDAIVIGAGMYGMYAAPKLAASGHKTLVIEAEEAPFKRGSLVNQARLHNGYHYPRSFSTAMKSSKYYTRFLADYGECIERDFQQIYALASHFSWTNAQQFESFCKNLKIQCSPIPHEDYFNPYNIEAAFLTDECSFDANILANKLYQAAQQAGVAFAFNAAITNIKHTGSCFVLEIKDGRRFQARFILNASYAGVNQIHALLGYPPLDIKYELCEVALCRVSDNLKGVGLTVMDGPFFSLMPFGKTGYHSITTVSRTPHITSYDALPTFPCQEQCPTCTAAYTRNCNTCDKRPKTAFPDMLQMAKKYLHSDIKIERVRSLFTLKPILKTSEIDDSRPTIIRQYSTEPYFFTIFSGKINTMYDLDEVLDQFTRRW
jgi:hypothetical protein